MSSYDSNYGAGGSLLASSLPNMSSIPTVITDNKSQQDRMRNKYYLSLGMNRPTQPPPPSSTSSSSINNGYSSKASTFANGSSSLSSSSDFKPSTTAPSPIHTPLNGSPNKERSSTTVGFTIKSERPINMDSSPSETFANRSRRSNTTPIPFNPGTGATPSAPINMPLGSLARRSHLNQQGVNGFDSEDEDSDYGNPLNRSVDDMPPQTFEEDFFLQKQKLKHPHHPPQKSNNSHPNRNYGHQRNDSEDESPFIPPHLLMKQNAPSFEVGTAHSLAVENRRRNMMDNL